MSDFNRAAPAAASAGPLRHVTLTTSGPLFSSQDFAALIVAAIMVLGPLAMGAFWAAHQ